VDPNPPFHTPVFVLTHHTRPSIEMEGGTTYHFLDVPPAEALETAREAADGKDVRIGGGATVIREFLAAGLVDHMHVVLVPILLGRGVRLWDGLEGLEKDYQVEGHLLAQRSHARDLHPWGRLIRCLDQDTTLGRAASSSRLRSSRTWRARPYEARDRVRTGILFPASRRGVTAAVVSAWRTPARRA
jgi:dihydrofolate reductase